MGEHFGDNHEELPTPSENEAQEEFRTGINKKSGDRAEVG